ncbi:MAG: hypothetical protein WBB67_02080 [bacterium]
MELWSTIVTAAISAMLVTIGYLLRYLFDVKLADRTKRRELYIKLCGLRSISRSILDDTLEAIISFFHAERQLNLYIGSIGYEDQKSILKTVTLQWNERCMIYIKEQNIFNRQLNETLQTIPVLRCEGRCMTI